eukprot:10500584-Alexandrium_andersonii.AAC.1
MAAASRSGERTLVAIAASSARKPRARKSLRKIGSRKTHDTKGGLMADACRTPLAMLACLPSAEVLTTITRDS